MITHLGEFTLFNLDHPKPTITPDHYFGWVYRNSYFPFVLAVPKTRTDFIPTNELYFGFTLATPLYE